MSGRTWDRLINESELAYAAFCSYRDCAPPRPDPVQFAVIHGLTLDEMLDFAERFQWRARAFDRDRFFERKREAFVTEAISQSVEEIEAQHREVMKLGRDMLRSEMMKLYVQSQKSPRSTMDPKDLFKLMQQIISIDREVLQQAADVRPQDVDFASMPDEVLGQIDALTKPYKK